MHSIYLCLSYLFHVFAGIFLKIRVFKKKEDRIRYKEKLGIYKKKNTDSVLWFHASSLGEIKSILPLIFYYNKKNKKILITTVTKSSAEYCKSIFKKNSNIIHQYAPLDTPIIVNKFLIKKFQIKKIKYLGNLKFCEDIQTYNVSKNNDKNKIPKWVAMSTHNGEESFIIDTMKKIKEKKIQSQCYLIPRHIDRVSKIKSLIEDHNLTYTLHSKKIKKNKVNDFFIVDSYGQANQFLKQTNVVFIGGTIVNHGGQNPLEAARVGCRIFNGPFTQNFTEIFDFLKKNKISQLIKNKDELADQLIKCFTTSSKQVAIKRIIKKRGQKILLDHINYLNPYIN